jgi:hypothetical protein
VWTVRSQSIIRKQYPLDAATAGDGASSRPSSGSSSVLESAAMASQGNALIEVLLEVFGDVDYGGRVSDDRDCRTLTATLHPLLQLSVHRAVAVTAGAGGRRRSAVSEIMMEDGTMMIAAEMHPVQLMISGRLQWDLSVFSPPSFRSTHAVEVRRCCRCAVTSAADAGVCV